MCSVAFFGNVAVDTGAFDADGARELGQSYIENCRRLGISKLIVAGKRSMSRIRQNFSSSCSFSHSISRT